MKRQYPKKFCVIKQAEDPEIRNGQSGSNYWIAAEWSYYNGNVDDIMEDTPDWLFNLIEQTCPGNYMDMESDFWIPDSEIDALKAKADFYAEVGVTLANSSWNTHGEEEQEQEELDNQREANEQALLESLNQHFFNKIKPGTIILMNTAKSTVMGRIFAVGEFVGTSKDSIGNTTVVLKDPTIVEPDTSYITEHPKPKFTNKTGEESFLDASYGREVKLNIFPITDPGVSKDMLLNEIISKNFYNVEILN